MSIDEAIARLACEIYDAALNPHLWPKAIAEIVYYVGGVAGCLFRRDCASGAGQALYGFGDQPYYRRLYFDSYIRFDPASPAMLALGIGEVISNSSVTPHGEFVKTRFYKEWMKPQGWLDTVFVTLDRSPTDIIAFTLARGEKDGWADHNVYVRMQALAPHLRRAILLSRALTHRTVQEETLIETFDGFAAGMIFADAEGRIVHANTSAKALLGDQDLRAVLTDARHVDAPILAPALREAIRRAAAPGASAGVKSAAVPLTTASGELYVVHALPLGGGRRGAAPAHWAAAALFVQKAELGSPGAAEVIASHYKLTRMELRVLMSIVETGDVPRTAAGLRIAETTAKTHLRRLFAKTGTSRQLELAKLVAGFSSAFSR
jgi:DNA-binding CsgD family transcriptional regulator